MSVPTDYGIKKIAKNDQSFKKVVNNHVFVGLPQFGIYYVVKKILKKLLIQHEITNELLSFLTSYAVMLLLYKNDIYKEYTPTIEFINGDNPTFWLFFYYNALKALT